MLDDFVGKLKRGENTDGFNLYGNHTYRLKKDE